MASEKKRLMSELAPSPHLEAADLHGDTVVTIKSYEWHEVGEQKVIKGIVYFNEFERGMVINKTNRVLLQHLFGQFIDDMVGKQITIYQAETTFGGKVVPCLRIRGTLPKPSDVKLHERQKQSA